MYYKILQEPRIKKKHLDLSIGETFQGIRKWCNTTLFWGRWCAQTSTLGVAGERLPKLLPSFFGYFGSELGGFERARLALINLWGWAWNDQGDEGVSLISLYKEMFPAKPHLRTFDHSEIEHWGYMESLRSNNYGISCKLKCATPFSIVEFALQSFQGFWRQCFCKLQTMATLSVPTVLSQPCRPKDPTLSWGTPWPGWNACEALLWQGQRQQRPGRRGGLPWAIQDADNNSNKYWILMNIVSSMIALELVPLLLPSFHILSYCLRFYCRGSRTNQWSAPGFVRIFHLIGI